MTGYYSTYYLTFYRINGWTSNMNLGLNDLIMRKIKVHKDTAEFHHRAIKIDYVRAPCDKTMQSVTRKHVLSL